MKPPHVLCVVVALVAVCILVGFVLRSVVLGPKTAGNPFAEAAAPAEEFATNDDDDDEAWGGESDDGFGGGLGVASTLEYPERTLPLAWVEAMFLQVATGDLDDIRIGDQPAFARGSEKLLLTADEKGALLDALKAKPSFRIIASASVTTISGNQAVMQFVESLPYLTERDTESAMAEAPETDAEDDDEIDSIRCWPGLELEEIEVGVRLSVTPTISCDGEVMTLVLLPEVAQISGWADFGSGPPQPLYRHHNLITAVYLRDGMSVLMPGVPLSQHGGAPHPNVKSPEEPLGENTVLVLITARIIELPVADEPQTDQPPTEPPSDAELRTTDDDPRSF